MRTQAWLAGAMVLVIASARLAAAGSCAGKPDGATCDSGSDQAHVLTCRAGVCGVCSGDSLASPRFFDNGDGTITDRLTCLVWEKKDNAGGIHDLNNVYQWSSSGTAADGDLFTTFLAGLNSAGFAGHHDWRIPTAAGQNGSTTGQPAEAESIEVNVTCGDGIGGCMPAEFNTACGPYSLGDPPYTTGNPGCTVDGANGTSECSCGPFYHTWTDSLVVGSPNNAWLECYTVTSHGLSSPAKTDSYNGRAVRGSMAAVPTITCSPSPLSGCFAPGQSRLTLTNKPGDSTRNKLTWSWAHGEAVDAASLGDPTSATDYALCVYAAGSLLVQATIAHGSNWSARSKAPAIRYGYRDSSGSSSGVRKASLAAGDARKTKAFVSATGAELASVSTPLAAGQLPVRVQLISTDASGACWTSDFTNAPVRNDNKTFKVRLP